MLIKGNKQVLPLDFALYGRKKKARISEQALCIIKILECTEGKMHTVHCLIISWNSVAKELWKGRCPTLTVLANQGGNREKPWTWVPMSRTEAKPEGRRAGEGRTQLELGAVCEAHFMCAFLLHFLDWFIWKFLLVGSHWVLTGQKYLAYLLLSWEWGYISGVGMLKNCKWSNPSK